MITLKIVDILLKLDPIVRKAGVIASNAAEQLVANPDFLPLTKELTNWLLILAGLIFLIWFVFEFLAYWNASRMFKKITFLNYFAKFFTVSLFYFVLIVLSFYMTIKLGVLNTMGPIAFFPQPVINIILFILLLIITYFMYLNLFFLKDNTILNSFKKIFKTNFKKAIKAYFLVLTTILLAILALVILSFVHTLAIFLGFIFVLIPMLSFSRILFFKALSN